MFFVNVDQFHLETPCSWIFRGHVARSKILTMPKTLVSSSSLVLNALSATIICDESGAVNILVMPGLVSP